MIPDKLRFAQVLSCGSEGCHSRAIDVEYRDSPIEFSESIERKVARVWEELSARDSKLFDGPLMSLYDVSDDTGRLYTEGTSYRYYLTKLSLLEGSVSPEEYGFTGHEIRRIHKRLNVLSSFTAVIVEGQLLAGVRSSSHDDGPRVSFPGSGYLDPSEDVSDSGDVRPTPDIVRREVEEELGITSDGIDIRCRGVYGNSYDGHVVNPALFSEIRVSLSRTAIERASRSARDSWEFDRFVYLPIEAEFLEELLTEAPLIPKEVIGLGRSVGLSSKACLMILLVGQTRFGTAWAESVKEDADIEIFEIDAV